MKNRCNDQYNDICTSVRPDKSTVIMNDSLENEMDNYLMQTPEKASSGSDENSFLDMRSRPRVRKKTKNIALSPKVWICAKTQVNREMKDQQGKAC